MAMRIRGLLVAGALIGALAGCGGDDEGEELSATAFRERANQVCKDLLRANEAAYQGVDIEDEGSVVAANDKAEEARKDALDDLGDLNGPEEAEALVDRFVARAREANEAFARYGAQLSEGDDGAAEAEEEAKRLGEETDATAKAAGLDACLGK